VAAERKRPQQDGAHATDGRHSPAIKPGVTTRTRRTATLQMCGCDPKVSEQPRPALPPVQRARPIPKEQSDLSHPSGSDRAGPLETLGEDNQLTMRRGHVTSCEWHSVRDPPRSLGSGSHFAQARCQEGTTAGTNDATRVKEQHVRALGFSSASQPRVQLAGPQMSPKIQPPLSARGRHQDKRIDANKLQHRSPPERS
jgi:hypothetical protein